MPINARVCPQQIKARKYSKHRQKIFSFKSFIPITVPSGLHMEPDFMRAGDKIHIYIYTYYIHMYTQSSGGNAFSSKLATKINSFPHRPKRPFTRYAPRDISFVLGCTFFVSTEMILVITIS